MVNPYNKYIKQYQNNSVTTVTPEKLMLLLLDYAIQFAQKAKLNIEQKQYLERSDNIAKSRAIVRELMRTIDLENGNTVSKRIFFVYNRVARNLVSANIKKDTTILDKAIEDLSNLKWGFQKAVEIETGIITLDDAIEQYKETVTDIDVEEALSRLGDDENV